MTPARKMLAAAKGGGLGAKLLRGGMGSLALKLSNKALTLLVAVALARILQPDGYGVYSFVVAVLTLVAVPVKMGLPMLVMRETASASTHDNHALVGALWRWSTRLVLLASGIVLLAGFLALWASHGWMDGHRRLTFAFGLPAILFMGLSALRAAALRGLYRVVLSQLPEMLVRPLLVLAGIGVVILLAPQDWLTSERAMALYTLSSLGAFMAGAFLVRRFRPAAVHSITPSAATARAWISAIIPLAALSGTNIINKNTDIVMLGLLGSDAQVGVYRVAMQGGLLVIFGTQALNQVFMPYFSSVRARGDTAQLQRLVTAGAYATTLIALLVAVIFWLFGPMILTFVFGSEYVTAYLPLSILAGGQVFSAVMGQVGALLNMTGYERQTLIATIVSFGLNIILNITLIPSFGMAGAAIATSVSLAALNVILWLSVRRRLGINTSALAVIHRSGRRDDTRQKS